ncbi:hypothetical protein CspeluHIS016_0303460 [Cutaneotrichosporon spelunceum]|uniref:Thioredoxin domain-containing protein n=1 Tax=Cutaneotrichosporon spelunceum TaxID=1672016 RepID=A0AAD3TU18_9TREE|nr:hypothetical protein CspeluHIS016_0303460 [Cutaneotrichosporon spelunceum]
MVDKVVTPHLPGAHSPPSSTSHHTPTTPTFDLLNISTAKRFSRSTMVRLSGTPGSGWRDSSTSFTSNVRDSTATVTSSRSINLRELPEVCVKFPLPPTKEMHRRSGSASSLCSSLRTCPSQVSILTDATERANSPQADAQVLTATRAPTARGVQVRQVRENRSARCMSLVSTETGESAGFMPTSPTTPTSQEMSSSSVDRTPEKRHGKQWFPVAPVWGSATPSERYSYLASTTTLDEDTLQAGPEAPRGDVTNSQAANGSVDSTMLSARVGGMGAQTRESLAAWDEDMPLPTPPLSSQSRFGDSTNGFEPPSPPHSSCTSVTHHAPSLRHTPKGSTRHANGRDIGSQFSLASSSSAMADYDSDGSDGSDNSLSGDASPFGRTSFGCDAPDDDATEDRARKLREAFFPNTAAGRSHSSLTSVEDRAKTPTHLRGVSEDSNMGSIVGLRSAVLTQPMARHSVDSLHETVAASAAGPMRNVPLRKKSLTNLLRKRNEEERKGEVKKLPRLPAPAEADEYYIDTDPESVYNVCNDKYLRKTLLSPPEPEIDEVFNVWRPPSQRRMWEAGTCTIRDEDGNLMPFSDLFPTWEDAPPSGPPPRVLLIFLRHFWCGPCQDYTLESISTLDTQLLAANNIKVAVVGSGHWKLLKPYRALFKCPFPFYTDGPRKLFHLLGLIKQASVLPFKFPWRDAERGGYNHRPLMKQAVAGFKNAFLHMPMAYPGHFTQLGGEFVLSPGYKCDFAHRMTTMANHMEAYEVLHHIKVNHPPPSKSKALPAVPTLAQEEAREEIDRLTRELRQWQDDRDTELQRMKNKRSARRGGLLAPADDKAFRRISATSTWSGYVRTVLRDEAAAELAQMPEIPAAHRKDGATVVIGPEVVHIGPESDYIEEEAAVLSDPVNHNTSLRSSGVPDLVDSQSASTGLDSLCSRTCSLDPEVSATFGGIAGSPVEPDSIDPAEMERRFAAAMAAARGQERIAAATNNRWSMPPQLPQRDTNPATEVGVAY